MLHVQFITEICRAYCCAPTSEAVLGRGGAEASTEARRVVFALEPVTRTLQWARAVKHSWTGSCPRRGHWALVARRRRPHARGQVPRPGRPAPVGVGRRSARCSISGAARAHGNGARSGPAGDVSRARREGGRRAISRFPCLEICRLPFPAYFRGTPIYAPPAPFFLLLPRAG